MAAIAKLLPNHRPRRLCYQSGELALESAQQLLALLLRLLLRLGFDPFSLGLGAGDDLPRLYLRALGGLRYDLRRLLSRPAKLGFIVLLGARKLLFDLLSILDAFLNPQCSCFQRVQNGAVQQPGQQKGDQAEIDELCNQQIRINTKLTQGLFSIGAPAFADAAMSAL